MLGIINTSRLPVLPKKRPEATTILSHRLDLLRVPALRFSDLEAFQLAMLRVLYSPTPHIFWRYYRFKSRISKGFSRGSMLDGASETWRARLNFGQDFWHRCSSMAPDYFVPISALVHVDISVACCSKNSMSNLRGKIVFTSRCPLLGVLPFCFLFLPECQRFIVRSVSWAVVAFLYVWLRITHTIHMSGFIQKPMKRASLQGPQEAREGAQIKCERRSQRLSRKSRRSHECTSITTTSTIKMTTGSEICSVYSTSP